MQVFDPRKLKAHVSDLGVLAMMKFFQVQCLVWALSHVLESTWSILDSAPTKYDSNSGFSRISFGSLCTCSPLG